ncbi:MAG: iron ABC transporter permease [Thermodesulfobacteriota bacterium]
MEIRSTLISATLGLVLAATIVASTTMGFLSITPLEVLQIIGARLKGATTVTGIEPSFIFVVWDVRLPRILTAAVVGGGLAVAGAVFQGILLNPLADPYTLGVSSGAAFGASLALILSIIGISMPAFVSVPLFAFIGAMATLAAVFSLSSRDESLSSNSLILAGVIVAAILSAGIGFIKYLADEQVSVIIFWLMGSFVGRSWSDVLLVGGLTLPTMLVIFYFARDLNIMSLGERTADTLGVDSSRIKKILLLCASLISAVAVSVSGVIGFVGLIVPHLLRAILGPDNRTLLPACFFGGGILLLLADTLTRAWLPSELPIGILTSLLGGPFFCYIFRRKQLGRSS